MAHALTDHPCQVCGSLPIRPLYQVTDTNQDVPGTWTIVACETCGLGRLDPMPTPAEVGAFYRDVFYAEDGQRFRPWMETLRRDLSGLRGRRLRRMLPRGRLLDFGAGSGHFADALRLQGWDSVAHEPFSTADTAGASQNVATTALDCPDGHYDAVTLWYVIEHLVDPRGAIREFHRALRTGGILVLAQQDFSSVQARVFRERWLFLDPPRHLFQFTPDTLTRMAEQEGFRLRHVSSASLEMGPFTILQSLLNCVTGNRNHLFRFLKNRQVAQRSSGAAQGGATRAGLLASLVLLPLLGPAAVALYFILLPFRSGDVFTLYLERLPSRPAPPAASPLPDDARS